jgi:hypothetical protein
VRQPLLLLLSGPVVLVEYPGPSAVTPTRGICPQTWGLGQSREGGDQTHEWHGLVGWGPGDGQLLPAE